MKEYIKDLSNKKQTKFLNYRHANTQQANTQITNHKL